MRVVQNKAQSSTSPDGALRVEDLAVGDRVTFVYPLDFGGKPSHGRVKRVEIPGVHNAVFVVFHCNEQWDDFMNYTAQLTNLQCLRLGWL